MTTYSYQLYSSRAFPPLADTLSMLQSIGYAQVEAYGDLLTEPRALLQAVSDTGMQVRSAHVGLDLLRSDLARITDISKKLGIELLFCPHIETNRRPADASGWRALGAELGEIGEVLAEDGLVLGWHNHDFEFEPLADGSIPMQHLLAGHPSLCWEIDIAWIARGGADPIAWIEQYGNRIVAAHVKDIAPAGQCIDEDGWADVGHGILDWPALAHALRRAGVDLFVVEHDNPNDHRRFATRSLAALQAMEAA